MTWLVIVVLATGAFLGFRIWWNAGVSEEIRKDKLIRPYLERSTWVGFAYLSLAILYVVAATHIVGSAQGSNGIWPYLIAVPLALAAICIPYDLSELIGKGLIRSCEEEVRKEAMKNEDNRRMIDKGTRT